jgi:DNA sulfur modification protein DndD
VEKQVKFRSLSLENWGPFEGKHQVDFSVTDASPVVIIHGENGRGKTSIMRSFFWGLYGTVRDSYGATIPLNDLVNNRCTAGKPEAEFGVTLTVEFEDETYEVERRGIARGVAGSIITDSLAFTVRKVGEHPLSESKALELISLMLEEAIADFYLFDGEKLSATEKRLSKSDDDHQQYVQKTVERALGLSFIDRLRADLESIRRDFSEVLSSHARLEAETQKLISRQSDLSDQIKSKQDDREALMSMRTELERERDRIQGELQDFDLVRDKVVERQLLSKDVVSLEGKLEDVRRHLKQEAELSWYWPLSKKLDQLAADFAEKRQLSEKVLARAQDIRGEISLLETALNGHSCSLCGSDLSEPNRKNLNQKLSTLQSEIASLGEIDHSDYAGQLNRLSAFQVARTRFPLLEEVTRELGRLELELSNKTSRIAELTQQIGAGSTPDIISKERERDNAIVRIGEATKLLGQLDEQIRTEKSNLSNIQMKLANSAELDPKDKKKLSLLEELNKILGDSYDEFREQMRVQVEKAATSILRALSSEQDYQNVSISPKYQVDMRDSDLSIVPIPSSGYSQILALSFIGGLADVAGQNNAVVMDTPWGRVDRGNRKLIMSWIKSRSNQTLIFVQSGELTIEEARAEFGHRLGRQLTIERVSVNSSKIREV